ncbi:MAG: glycosyltransferase family 92 protein [Alphaproteobacteria bacterium]|nr:glycosyltransferase family 92 protein [Alphaproteobacteria bacterium]
MKKLFIRIICAFIPSKKLRHVVRNASLLEYFKVLYFNFFNKRTSINFKYNLSICLIVKNAAKYMDEWINYHKLVGIDHFYIYDNESEDNLKEVLKPYIKSGLVDYMYVKGKGMQSKTYNYCIKVHRFETKWLAMIDDDEFILPMKHKTVTEVLDFINPKNALAISWCMYGSNGYKKYEDKLVIERFTKHIDLNTKSVFCCKTIINPRRTVYFEIHNGHYIKGNAVDENGKILKKAYENFYTGNLIRINHYHLKSLEENLAKKKRGDASYSGKAEYEKANEEYFNAVDKFSNVTEDDTMKKYVPQVKKMIKKVRG